MVRPAGPALLVLGLLSTLTSGCGSVDDQALSAAPSGSDDGGGTGGGTDAGLVNVFNPFQAGGVTIGTLCGPEGPQTRIVFTAEPANCQRHAELLAGANSRGDQAVLARPDLVEGPTQFQASAEVCLDGRCEARSILVEIDTLADAQARGRWSIPLGERTASGNLNATVCAYDAFLPGRDPSLVPNLAVTEVAIYQGVKIPLVLNATVAPRQNPIIESRPALVRVFVEPQPGFMAETVSAELSWDMGDGSSPALLKDQMQVLGGSREAARGSTFDFDLAAEQVAANARWAIALKSSRACAGASGSTENAKFPSTGWTSLRPEAVGTFNVVLVPIRYDADGSARLPDTSEAQLDRYRRRLMGIYPVPEVNLVVREPVRWSSPIQADGAGWANVLQALLSLRAQDAPPPNTYYYGIFSPADSLRTFCGRACVLGLGPLPRAGDEALRGAIGLGFAGEITANTCAHELGHVNGRRHAPCNVRDPDPNYPRAYGQASIGVWGYDITDGTLKDPARFRDMMSYCEPEWISDYNYTAIYERLSFVNRTQSDLSNSEPTRWRMLSLSAEGAAWDEVIEYRNPPFGEPVQVHYLGVNGAVLGQDAAAMVRLDHLDDLIFVIPEAPVGTTHVQIPNSSVIPY